MHTIMAAIETLQRMLMTGFSTIEIRQLRANGALRCENRLITAKQMG
jgi:hypothetical protein